MQSLLLRDLAKGSGCMATLMTWEESPFLVSSKLGKIIKLKGICKSFV